MTKIDKLRRQNKETALAAKETLTEFRDLGNECIRVADVAKNVNIIITDLDKQFKQASGLTGRDIAFMFLAVGLQVIRQYVQSI